MTISKFPKLWDHFQVVPERPGSENWNKTTLVKSRTKQLSQPFQDRFWCSRCLNDGINLPNMIGSFACGATASMVAKSRTKKIFHTVKICTTLIAISPYLEAKFDYSYFIIFFVLWFHDSTQKISSHFEQKWRRDGDFSEFWFQAV